MYLEHFGLKETPFSISPDPRYLYMSEGHREALAHLLYGINNDAGFVLLTGEIGTGKTTVCRCLLEKMPQDIETAFILNPKLSAEELLASVCDEFRVGYPPGNRSIKVFTDLINGFLLSIHASGKRAVLIVEEAQNLSTDVLEQLRLLTNLETSQRKLLQIILLGQPELREILDRPEMMQLAQRITARYHLGPLARKEMESYVSHRIAVAGRMDRIFPGSLMPSLFRLSGGVPRVINVICDRAMLGAFVQDRSDIDRRTLVNAAREVAGVPGRSRKSKGLGLVLAGLCLIGCGTLITSAYYHVGPGQASEEKVAAVSRGKAGSDSRWDPADFFPLLSMQLPYGDRSSANARGYFGDTQAGQAKSEARDFSAARPAEEGHEHDGDEIFTEKTTATNSGVNGRETGNVVHP